MWLTEPPKKTSTEYNELLWRNDLICNQLYNNYVFKRKHIKQLEGSTRKDVCFFRASNTHVTAQDLAAHKTALTNLQNGSSLQEGAQSRNKHPSFRKGEKWIPDRSKMCPSNVAHIIAAKQSYFYFHSNEIQKNDHTTCSKRVNQWYIYFETVQMIHDECTHFCYIYSWFSMFSTLCIGIVDYYESKW